MAVIRNKSNTTALIDLMRKEGRAMPIAVNQTMTPNDSQRSIRAVQLEKSASGKHSELNTFITESTFDLTDKMSLQIELYEMLYLQRIKNLVQSAFEHQRLPHRTREKELLRERRAHDRFLVFDVPEEIEYTVSSINSSYQSDCDLGSKPYGYSRRTITSA